MQAEATLATTRRDPAYVPVSATVLEPRARTGRGLPPPLPVHEHGREAFFVVTGTVKWFSGEYTPEQGAKGLQATNVVPAGAG